MGAWIAVAVGGAMGSVGAVLAGQRHDGADRAAIPLGHVADQHPGVVSSSGWLAGSR